jgi:molybdopterin molybdotransferase
MKAVTITEAIEAIHIHTQALKSEILPLESSLGRISAQTYKARLPLPNFNNSAMDGFGLCGESDTYQIIGKVLAGESQHYTLKEGECITIMTGAKVPKSVQRIIPQEHTQVSQTEIKIERPINIDANIRKKGEDINIGEVILEKSEKITSAHIALLASQGITHLEVFRKPRVAVFASGHELKLHYETLQESQIYNSNTPYLLARSQEWGCESIFIGKAEDSIEAIQECIHNALEYDFIVTSGGVSVGEADFTKEAFATLGCENIFSKVQIKPGKPTTFGKIGNTLILNLPGNPLASTLNFEILGKLLIMKLRGSSDIHHGFINSKISQSFTLNRPTDTVLPGYFDGQSFTPAHKFAPGNVNVLNHCNGMIIIDKTTKELKENDLVKFLPINWEFLKKDFVKFTS